jgi:hypothetical protein
MAWVDAGATACAQALAITKEPFLARFGVPMPPRAFGDTVVRRLSEPQFAAGMAVGLKGDTDITILEDLEDLKQATA